MKYKTRRMRRDKWKARLWFTCPLCHKKPKKGNWWKTYVTIDYDGQINYEKTFIGRCSDCEIEFSDWKVPDICMTSQAKKTVIEAFNCWYWKVIDYGRN